MDRSAGKGRAQIWQRLGASEKRLPQAWQICREGQLWHTAHWLATPETQVLSCVGLSRPRNSWVSTVSIYSPTLLPTRIHDHDLPSADTRSASR